MTEVEFVGYYNEHSRRARRMIGRDFGSKVSLDDVMQNAWMLAWTRKDDYQGRNKAAFSTWFNRIAVNAAITSLRRQKTARLEFPGVFDHDIADPLAEFESEIIRRDQLSKTMKVVVKLRPSWSGAIQHYLDGKPVNLQDRDTIRVRVHYLRGVRDLRRKMQPYA